MSIQVGIFTLDNPFFLAPMAGITDSPFRQLIKHYKAGLVISELLSATAISYKNEQTQEMAEFEENERPIGLQIHGADMEEICQAGKFVESLKADFVDLNLGCSVPKVVKKGAGSALARDTQKLEKILIALVQSVKIPVTIKIRLGWDENHYNANEVIRVASNAGVMWVTVHGRTSVQGYAGQANWNAIGELKAQSMIPIIGNGDISSPEMAVGYLKKYGVDAIMIGRYVPRSPFIFKQAHALWSVGTYEMPTCQDYISLLHEHRALLEKNYDTERAIFFIRKFLIWYTTGFTGCHAFRAEVFSLKNWESIWEYANQFFIKLEQTGDWKSRTPPKVVGDEM